MVQCRYMQKFVYCHTLSDRHVYGSVYIKIDLYNIVITETAG